MSKFYRVTLTATAYVSTAVIVEIGDDELDEGLEVDDTYIADKALEQAEYGSVDWELDSVDDDTIDIGTVRRKWSE